MKRYVKASYESRFWELHDRDMETGIALEEIVDDFGMEEKFFPYEGDDITATEDDYRIVLNAFSNADEEVSDQFVKELISTKLLKYVPDYAAQFALRSIIFSDTNQIDWQDAYQKILEQMPELIRR